MNLKDYSDALNQLYVNWRRQLQRLGKYQRSLYKFKDESTIEWTVAQKQKALNHAQEDVTEFETVTLPKLKQALDM